MLNFKELAQDGQDFELLVREILFRAGFHVVWSGRGADGGRDLVCTDTHQTILGIDQKKWLIQCKHFAHSGRSVGVADLDDIVTSAVQHKCTGYLLACSTFPSSAVVQRLEGIAANADSRMSTNYWDAVQIERQLATPQMWRVAQRFFPDSATGFELYATEKPNRWIVNYKGYYFHLSNRIGSASQMHLQSIAARVAEIEAIQLPGQHHLRIRAVYYDDKNGGYRWYLDYLRPRGQMPYVSTPKLKEILKDGWALEDGQSYNFDIVQRNTSPSSDHFDMDHYDYYSQGQDAFGWGGERSALDVELFIEELQDNQNQQEKLRTKPFNGMIEALSKLSFVQIIRAVNCNVESIRDFGRRWDWSELFETGVEADRFFSVWIYLRATDELEFRKLMMTFPQERETGFRLTKPSIYLPADGGDGCQLSEDVKDNIYELTLNVHASDASDMHTTRARMNDYLDQIAQRVLTYAELRRDKA